MYQHKVLIVEDENIVAKDIEKILSNYGYIVTGIAANAKDAISNIKYNRPDLILLDIILKGDIDGIHLAKMIQKDDRIPIIYITAYSDEDTLKRLLETKPYGYLTKPFEEKELLINLELALLNNTPNEKENYDTINQILDNIKDCIFITDDSDNVKYLNTAAENEFLIKLYNCFGKNLCRIFDTPSLNISDVFKYQEKLYRIKFVNENINENKVKEKVYILEKAEDDEEDYFKEIVYKHLNEIILILDSDFSIKFISDNANKILGYNKNSLNKNFIFELLNKDDINKFINLTRSTENKENNEFRFIHNDNSILTFDVKSYKIATKSGKNLYLITLQDVSSWRKAEDDLKDLMKRLSASNKELENFAYIASHDMQEPLRMIASYIQLIKKRYLEKLDEEAIEYINYSVDGVNILKNLINDLLSYSRLTLSQEPNKEIDCNDIVSQIETEFKQSINDCNGLIVYDKLPLIYGNENQIKQLFKHLISNSLKFRSKKSPRVIIKHIQNNGAVQITVKDNGIGIDYEYKDKIFQIFTKLHNNIDYPGTGIGLAICKKIVENHNGKIWFESEPDKGSTFYIELPNRINYENNRSIVN